MLDVRSWNSKYFNVLVNVYERPPMVTAEDTLLENRPASGGTPVVALEAVVPNSSILLSLVDADISRKPT